MLSFNQSTASGKFWRRMPKSLKSSDSGCGICGRWTDLGLSATKCPAGLGGAEADSVTQIEVKQVSHWPLRAFPLPSCSFDFST
jgi:hypothetical protein